MSRFESERSRNAHPAATKKQVAQLEAELARTGDQSPEAFDAALKKVLDELPKPARREGPTFAEARRLLVVLDRRIVDAGLKIEVRVVDTKHAYLAERGYEVHLEEREAYDANGAPFPRDLPLIEEDPLDAMYAARQRAETDKEMKK